MTRLTLAFAGVLVLQAAALDLGKPLEVDKPIAVAELLEKSDSYVGKTVQVRGKITEVCQMMGCWIMIRDQAGAMVRIKVNDGEIIFPKDSPGRSAIAEGVFKRFELTEEQAIAAAKHEAEELGRPFDPDSVKGPQTVFQIQGTGARLLD